MDTERPSPRYSDIDVWEPSDIAEAMIEGQFTAVAAVRAARYALVAAALAAEAKLRQGGRLVYVGAGTSGRLAVQDGAELMPTFSWPQDRLLLLIAGGRDALLRSVEGAEDAVDQAVRLVQQHEIGGNDVRHRRRCKWNHAIHAVLPEGSEKAWRLDDRRCQQSRHTDPGGGRSRDLAGYRR